MAHSSERRAEPDLVGFQDDKVARDLADEFGFGQESSQRADDLFRYCVVRQAHHHYARIIQGLIRNDVRKIQVASQQDRFRGAGLSGDLRIGGRAEPYVAGVHGSMAELC